MAGYSGTPLPQKLGIKAGHRVVLLEAPTGFAATLGRLPESAGVVVAGGPGSGDVVLLFAAWHDGLAARLSAAKALLPPDGALWLCWPKKAAKRPGDLDENRIRDIGLAAGLVDVKVCAVDEIWSGLKFVYRLADRPGRG
jgi:hypothetical protein